MIDTLHLDLSGPDAHAQVMEQLSQLNQADLPGWKRDVLEFLQQWYGSEPNILVKTSGSTGTPKTIAISRDKMLASAQMTGAHFKLQRGDKALLCLSAGYIAGKMMLVRAIALGLKLTAVEPTGHPLKSFSDPIDFSAMIPLQLEQSLEEPEEYQRIESIGTLLIGGGPISGGLAQRTAELTNGIYHTYGMTETVSHVAVKRISDPTESHFQALPGVQFRVNASECLVIDADHLHIQDLETTDLVKLSNHQAFEWLGRNTNIVNSGGVKVIPEQIEDALMPLVNCRILVGGLPDDRLGQKVVLVIEGESWPSEQLEALTQNWIDLLPPYHVPREVHFVPQFAETPTGKIQRQQTLALLPASQ